MRNLDKAKQFKRIRDQLEEIFKEVEKSLDPRSTPFSKAIFAAKFMKDNGLDFIERKPADSVWSQEELDQAKESIAESRLGPPIMHHTAFNGDIVANWDLYPGRVQFHPGIEQDPEYPSEQARLVIEEVWPRVRDRFLKKNKDYAENAGHLGLKGQFADINRKFWKLKREWWDGNRLESEPGYEVAEDMIAHLLLALLFMEDEGN